jgi:hypothetical protein
MTNFEIILTAFIIVFSLSFLIFVVSFFRFVIYYNERMNTLTEGIIVMLRNITISLEKEESLKLEE